MKKLIPAILALENEIIFRGFSFGNECNVSGELVFNTAMTGYQEIITDPSYCNQIINFTYTHIGNTGVNNEDTESNNTHLSAIVVKNYHEHFSNFRGEMNLSDYLKKQKVTAIFGVDTRKITRILRETGSVSAHIMIGKINEELAIKNAKNFAGIKGQDLAKVVSCDEIYEWKEKEWDLIKGYQNAKDFKYKIVVYDFGVKKNILRKLSSRKCRVIVVPARTSAEDVLEMNPDGVLLSNGPGDPEPLDYAYEAIKIFIQKKIPLFGICLGHQLLALAGGGAARKMKFGHHGANHPVKDLETGKVVITSQNHNFEIIEKSLPKNIVKTHESLFDGSLQGIAYTDRPAFGFQGHPEASPGPHDLDYLFDRFIKDISFQEKRLRTNA